MLIDTSDALKHSVEQKAILQDTALVDYTKRITNMKLLMLLVFKRLK